MNAPKLEPSDLAKEELLAIVEEMRDLLWPRECDNLATVTAEQIAEILEQYHLRP